MKYSDNLNILFDKVSNRQVVRHHKCYGKDIERKTIVMADLFWNSENPVTKEIVLILLCNQLEVDSAIKCIVTHTQTRAFSNVFCLKFNVL